MNEYEPRRSRNAQELQETSSFCRISTGSLSGGLNTKTCMLGFADLSLHLTERNPFPRVGRAVTSTAYPLLSNQFHISNFTEQWVGKFLKGVGKPRKTNTHFWRSKSTLRGRTEFFHVVRVAEATQRAMVHWSLSRARLKRF